MFDVCPIGIDRVEVTRIADPERCCILQMYRVTDEAFTKIFPVLIVSGDEYGETRKRN